MASATRTSRRTAAGKTAAAKPAAKRTATAARAANAKTASKTPAKPRAASKATSAKLDAGRRKAQAAEPTRKSPKRSSHAEKIKTGKEIIARMNEGEKLGEIASSLQLYPFQAHQLVALVHVDKGDVPAITGKSEDVLVKRLAAARAKGDEYASWDWLQARSGINKVKIQKLLVQYGHKITDVRNDRKGTARKSAKAPAAKAARSARKPVAATAKSARTRASAAKAATKPVTLSKNVKPAIKGELPAPGTAAQARAARAREAAAKKVAARKAAAAKPAAPVGRKANVGTRKRTPVNVPKGARPTTPDPS